LSDSFAARFRLARQQKKLTQVAVAKTLGVSQSAVAQWESGRSFPSSMLARRIEKLLEVKYVPRQDEEGASFRGAFGRRPRLPVFGSAAPGYEERILVDDRPRGEILAPPQLEGVKGAKAVYVRGDAMEPRYYAGEVVYLNPARSPNPGDFVFITLKEPGFPTEVGYIRQFVGSDLLSIRLATLNPKREQVIPRQEVIAIATIVGSGLF
jgi:phage repressor protein C with HTH and peptisase S24 domain